MSDITGQATGLKSYEQLEVREAGCISKNLIVQTISEVRSLAIAPKTRQGRTRFMMLRGLWLCPRAKREVSERRKGAIQVGCLQSEP